MFSATRASVPVLTADMLRGVMAARGGRPLVVFDMAVPRDVEPAAGEIPGVHLHAIDVIQSVVDAHMTERHAQVPDVERIVADETERFETWHRGLSATPTVVALRDHFERIRLEELDRLLANASEDERSRADRLTRALVNRLLHTPTVRLKDADPTSDDGRIRLQATRDLFALGVTAGTVMGPGCLSSSCASARARAIWRCGRRIMSSSVSKARPRGSVASAYPFERSAIG